jgi:bifunctional enzyme CysN/CysC
VQPQPGPPGRLRRLPRNRDTGGFILIDRLSNNTVGAGLINFALRRSHNIHLQHMSMSTRPRAALKGQKPCVLWFTGLSGAGKSTIANLVEKTPARHGAPHLPARWRQRAPRPQQGSGLHRGRPVENIRRMAEVAR